MGTMGRQLSGADTMNLPASVLGGPSGRPSPQRGSSLAARKARNADLAEAYPGTGMGGQLMLPAAAMGAHHHVAAYGEDGAQVSSRPHLRHRPHLIWHHAMHALEHGNGRCNAPSNLGHRNLAVGGHPAQRLRRPYRRRRAGLSRGRGRVLAQLWGAGA